MPSAPCNPPCTCLDKGQPLYMARWTARVQRVLQRMVAAGHGVDYAHLKETARLAASLGDSQLEAFLPDYLTHSHHLPDCPYAKAVRVGRSRPLVGVSAGG